jgi:nicotinamidase-related amidase
MPSVCPKAALLIIDVQNDFINGTMALNKCPAKQEGSEVVPIINNLIQTIPFDLIAYSLDWHPANHCSFIENVNLRKLSKYSPVILMTFNILK